MRRKINIVGKGRGWEQAPFIDGFDVLAITQMNLRIPCNMVIDMNDYSLWGEQEALEANASKNLALVNDVPYLDRDSYPLQEIMDVFGTDYFTSTVAYAIAWAIFKRYDEINLYGVPMEHHTEYAYQRPCVEFWIGLGRGLGIKINIHDEHTILLKAEDGKLYGFGFDQAWKKGKV